MHSRASGFARLAFLALLGGAVCIAFAPLFVRLSETGPLTSAFYRVFLSLPLLWLWAALDPHTRHAGVERRGTMPLLLAGFFFAMDLAIWHWSISLTSVANATLLANLAPIFVAAGNWWLFRERPSPLFLGSIAVGLGGAGILMGDSLSLAPGQLIGDLLGVATAFFYGAYILTVSRLRRAAPTSTVMAYGALASSAVLLPIAYLSGEDLFAAGATGWAVLIALALVSHTGGQSLIAYALAHLPAGFASVSLLLQPAVAAVLAWWLLDEPLRPWQAMGGIAVLAAIAMARRGSHPPPPRP